MTWGPLEKRWVNFKKIKAAGSPLLMAISDYRAVSRAKWRHFPLQQLRFTLQGHERFDPWLASSPGWLRGAGPAAATTNPGKTVLSAVLWRFSDLPFWDLSKSFPGRPYINGSVFGATAVMLAADFDTSLSPAIPVQ